MSRNTYRAIFKCVPFKYRQQNKTKTRDETCTGDKNPKHKVLHFSSSIIIQCFSIDICLYLYSLLFTG